MRAEDLLKWFNEELLPAIVKNGSFAEDDESQTIEKCELEDIKKGVSSFASAPCFAKLLLRTNSGIDSRDILVKFQCQDPLFREKMMTVALYNNEVTMYNKVLPAFVEFLKDCGKTSALLDKIAPRCYFASQGDGEEEKAIVILQDLRKLGYRLSESKIELDLRHIYLSVERLAEFHALSFAAEYRGWQPFEELKKSFEGITPDTLIFREHCEDFLKANAQRGVDHLLRQNDSEVPKEYLENFRKRLDPMFELVRRSLSPKGPVSVICHGDFNRNNCLYKYIEGEVSDVKFIDFQRALYGSPSVDLSFFIYMNTSQEFREEHFDDLLAFYYSALIRTISEILNESQEDITNWMPSQALREDFERVAIYSYVIVAFFLPFMVDPPEDDFEESMKSKGTREMAEENVARGGEKISKEISRIIVDFYRRGFYR